MVDGSGRVLAGVARAGVKYDPACEGREKYERHFFCEPGQWHDAINPDLSLYRSTGIRST
jgi:hypothetical protein